MNRRERRALYADHIGWTALELTDAEYDRGIAASLRGGADLERAQRRYVRRWRRERTPGATKRARRLERLRYMQRMRKLNRDEPF